MWLYHVVQSFVSIDDVQYTTFGIACGNIVIPDISTQENQISELVRRLNFLQLLPVHLQDVVDDFLVDCSYPIEADRHCQRFY